VNTTPKKKTSRQCGPVNPGDPKNKWE